MLDVTQDELERALSWVHVESDGCWWWIGSVSPGGYGQMSFPGGRKVTAHRLMYQAFVDDVPAGLELDHLCRVRHCCNPDHLEPVTHAENMRRAWITHCKRGHEFTEENTQVKRGPRNSTVRVCRTCRREREAALRG